MKMVKLWGYELLPSSGQKTLQQIEKTLAHFIFIYYQYLYTDTNYD